MAKEFNVMFH
jgi:hypothetical protein